jgi:hypothetical protein
MRYFCLFLLLLLSGCYYPNYGYPYSGGYQYQGYAPGYQPSYDNPNGAPPAYRAPPAYYGGPAAYPGSQPQSYGGAPQYQYGAPQYRALGPAGSQNCGTPDDPRPCSGSTQ